jgi:hypothetical protein
MVDPTYSYRLKGDDLIALWTPLQISFYKDVAATVGLVVNEKTWTHKSRGTFCEGDYELVETRSNLTVLRRLATFSLRSFVKNEPIPYQIGLRFVSRGVPIRTLERMQSHFHKSWLVLCREYGVNRFAPPSFGGLGFVSKPGRLLDSTTARICNAAHNGTLLFTEKDVIKYTGLAELCMRVYNGVKWSVYGQIDTELLESVFSRTLAACCFLDVVNGKGASSRVITPGKRVRSLYAYRKRFLASGIKAVSHRTSVETAYRVIDRLKPATDPVDYDL